MAGHVRTWYALHKSCKGFASTYSIICVVLVGSHASRYGPVLWPIFFFLGLAHLASGSAIGRGPKRETNMDSQGLVPYTSVSL